MSIESDLTGHLDRFLRAKGKLSRRSQRTLEWYERQLKPWFTWLAANAQKPSDWLDPDFLELFLEEEGERDVLESTVYARFKAIRSFLNWLKRRKVISGDLPTELIEQPSDGRGRKPRVADIADVDAVIRAAWQNASHWLDYRDVLLVQIMRSTGLRVEEIVNLKTWHVDTRDGFVYVEAGKGDKDRVVPFDDAFKKAFTAYVFNRPPHRGEWLLLAADGHRKPTGGMTTNAVRQAIRRRCKDAGVSYFNPHSVRHAFAIDRLNNGMQLSAVSAAMGHTSPAFTAKVYAKWVKAGLRREYDNASGLRGKTDDS
jgi:integrase/recombinase XerD